MMMMQLRLSDPLLFIIILQVAAAFYAVASVIPTTQLPGTGVEIRAAAADSADIISSSIVESGSSSSLLLYTEKDGDLFLDATQRWSEFSSPSAAVAVVASSVKDVVTTVKYASRHNVSLLATAGGNGWSTTLSSAQNALYLNLRQLKNIKLSKDGKTVTVGGGVTIADLIPVLQAAKKILPTGSCQCPGVVPVALGGGVGRLNGRYGMLSDQITSLTVVTAAGTKLTASETSNSDLFWAMRGAGHQFGVVTEMTLKVHDQINDGMQLEAEVVYEAAEVGKLFTLLRDIEVPPGLAVAIVFLGATQSDGTTGATLALNLVYDGGWHNGSTLLAPFLAIPHVQESVRNVTWPEIFNDVTTVWCQKGNRKSVHTAGLRTVDPTAISDAFGMFDGLLRSYPELAVNSWILFEAYGFANNIASCESAFAHRDVNVYAMVALWYQNKALDGELEAWGRAVRDRLQDSSGMETPAIYVNYAHGDESVEQVYGEDPARLQKLRSLKRRYDPNCLFCHYMSVV